MMDLGTLVKYRVHEVAKDFKVTSKVITEILTQYATTPKNHMQVLEDGELNLIFEYLTQHHQMENLADIYAAEPAAPAEPPKEPEKQAAPADAKSAGKPSGGTKPSAETAKSAAESAKPPAAPQKQASQPSQQQERQPQQPEKARQGKTPQKRVVDTSGVTINID